MKCRGYVSFVFVVNIIALTLKESHGQLENTRTRGKTNNDERNEINLLSRSKRFISKTTTASNEDPKPGLLKRSSSLAAKGFNAVNIPVPYAKVHLRPIHVARPYGYSKKPDVYIEHVHVHNGVNPCQHGGITLHTAGGFECLCKKQYKGKHCEERNYCYPNPCVNKGNCVEKEQSFVCNCLKGYKGNTCADVDPCARGVCKNGGVCLDLGASKVECSCPPGFKGKICEEIEHCDPNPCLHGGTCQEKGGKFACTCENDWSGSICELPYRCFINPCRNGGKCIEGQSLTVCKCKEGFYGQFCSDNVCHPNPCFSKGTCSVLTLPDKTSTYKCECKPTFAGEKCQVRNPCSSNLCKNGVCVDDVSDYHVDLPLEGYICICKDGFAGINCDHKICDNCDANAVCLYGKCVCKNGFVGNGRQCKRTSDICVPSPCKNGGKCVHAPQGSFDCACVQGFTGPLCESVTLCEPNPCKNGATCVITGATFKCVCPDGRAGPGCEEVKKKKCPPNFCLNGGVCRESENEKEPYCVCKTSKFQPPNCACSCEKANRNVDPNAIDPVCDNDGDCVCQDAERSYVSGSGCIKGFADPCQYFVCENGGTKTQSQGTCQCICPPDYSGSRCETKSGRRCSPNPCKNNGTCEEILGRIKCNCLQGFKPPFCERENEAAFAACGMNPCKNGGICQPLTVGYDCQCSPRYTGPHCEVDKCLKCHNDAECVEGVCKCKEGFVGNGYNCIVEITGKPADTSCFKCPQMTVCNSGVCQCIPGYVVSKKSCIPVNPLKDG